MFSKYDARIALNKREASETAAGGTQTGMGSGSQLGKTLEPSCLTPKMPFLLFLACPHTQTGTLTGSFLFPKTLET